MRLRKSNRRGTTLIEGSLCIVTFLLTMIGIFDVGYLLFMQQSIVERAQRAARHGSVNTFDATEIKNIVLYGQTSAPSGTAPAFGLNSSNITAERLDPGTTEDRIVVTVSNFNVTFFTPFIAKTIKGIPVRISMSYEN